MFTKNIVKYFDSGEAGNCPICGQKLLIKVYKTPIRDNFDITCSKCQKTQYFVGATKENDR